MSAVWWQSEAWRKLCRLWCLWALATALEESSIATCQLTQQGRVAKTISTLPPLLQEREVCSLMNYTPQERAELQLPHLIALAERVRHSVTLTCTHLVLELVRQRHCSAHLA